MRKIFILLLTASVILSVHRAGAAPSRLTEDAIRSFYRQSGEAHKKSFEDYVAFMNDAMADDFTMTDYITIIFSGRPPSVTKNRETKSSFLARVRIAYEGLKGASITDTVKKTEIADDGKSARVTEEETVRNLSIRVGAAARYFGNGKGDCDDRVILSDSGQIQVQKSVCTSRIIVSKGQSL